MAGKHGLDMLLVEYQNSPNLKKYIEILLTEFEEVSVAQEDSVRFRYLSDAFGMMLDDVAYLVGASRILYGAAALGYFGFYDEPSALPAGDDNNKFVGGVLKSDADRDSGDFVRNDTQLLAAIRARIIKIMGNCNVEQLIQYFDLIVGRSLKLEVKEGFKKIDYIVHEELTVADKVILSQMLSDFKPVGISITFADSTGNISLIENSKIYPPEGR